MTRIRFFHHCKIVLLATVIIAAAAGVCGLFWLNDNGFGGEWGDRIAAELSQRGVHAKFEEAHYSPFHGIIVKQAVFYTDKSKTKDTIFATIPDLRIDIDRSKALRGELVLRELVLSDAEIEIPLVSTPDEPTVANIHQLSGRVTIDRQGRFILRDGTGHLAGMDFTLNAEFDDFELSLLAGRTRDGKDDGSRARFLHTLFEELANWSITGSIPPKLDLRLGGNFSKPASIRTSFSLDADELSRNEYSMENIHLAGEFLGRHLTLDTFQYTQGNGRLNGRAGYDLKTREGRYELIHSTIDISLLLSKCFEYHGFDAIISPQALTIEGQGTFNVAPDGSVSLGATGIVDMPAFRFQRTQYEGLKTEFSWQDGDMFLRNLHVTHREGTLQGRVLIQGDTIRYSADSTLPISAYNAFIEEDSGLARMIAKAAFHKSSTIHLVAEGTIRRSNLKEWASNGTAELTNLAFNGVPLKSMKANYSMTQAEHIYTDIEGVFDYTGNPALRQAGPASALVRADRISHDRLSNFTRITRLRGTAWPGPVLRLFTPQAATHVENTYRFRSPPTFLTNGLVGHPAPARRPGVKDTTLLTDVNTTLRANGTTNYTFLNRNLALEEVTAEIRYWPPQERQRRQNPRTREVEITGLKCRAFGGPVGGSLKIYVTPGKPSSFRGGIHWTRLRLADIGNTYDFGKADRGYLTGRFDFRGVSGNVRALNGTGAIGLEHGHLFFVPILGPLSPVLGEILGDKRTSHEEARNASCTFAVKDGVFLTRDFLTSTPSTVFTGDGSIDLDRKTIDMTIRMNARGLFGLLTLPLRPFNGLFQFRGTGTLANPAWKKAAFVDPPDGKNDPLFRKPGRAVVIPGRAEVIPER